MLTCCLFDLCFKLGILLLFISIAYFKHCLINVVNIFDEIEYFEVYFYILLVNKISSTAQHLNGQTNVCLLFTFSIYMQFNGWRENQFGNIWHGSDGSSIEIWLRAKWCKKFLASPKRFRKLNGVSFSCHLLILPKTQYHIIFRFSCFCLN